MSSTPYPYNKDAGGRRTVIRRTPAKQNRLMGPQNCSPIARCKPYISINPFVILNITARRDHTERSFRKERPELIVRQFSNPRFPGGKPESFRSETGPKNQFCFQSFRALSCRGNGV